VCVCVCVCVFVFVCVDVGLSIETETHFKSKISRIVVCYLIIFIRKNFVTSEYLRFSLIGVFNGFF